jgi:hypothetical protein
MVRDAPIGGYHRGLQDLRSAYDVARACDLRGDVPIAGDVRGLHHRISALGSDLLDQRR